MWGTDFYGASGKADRRCGEMTGKPKLAEPGTHTAKQKMEWLIFRGGGCHLLSPEYSPRQTLSLAGFWFLFNSDNSETLSEVDFRRLRFRD